MTGIHTLASGTNSDAIIIPIGILVVVGGVVAVIVASWFRLQAPPRGRGRHGSYRKLAEEAVANQQELRDQLAKLTEKVQAVEQLMREVG